jgi:hypothetical protein
MDRGFPITAFDHLCAGIAASQFGLITRAQAVAAGMSPTMIADRLASGRWELVLPNVYRIVGAPDTREQRAMAVCLYGGPDAVLIERTAAAVWDLPGGCWDPPRMASPRQIKRQSERLIARRLSLASSDRTKHCGFPVTTLARTVVDLAPQVSNDLLERAIAQVARRSPYQFRLLRRRVEELSRSRVPAIGRVRTLLSDMGSTAELAESDLEVLVARFIRIHGFPKPTLQYWVTLPTYGPARLDFAFPRFRVGVEAQSHKWHGLPSAIERDSVRMSEFAALGWLIIQTTWRQISDEPAVVAQRLQRALDLRSGNSRSI